MLPWCEYGIDPHDAYIEWERWMRQNGAEEVMDKLEIYQQIHLYGLFCMAVAGVADEPIVVEKT